jgi:hypothetical protein
VECIHAEQHFTQACGERQNGCLLHSFRCLEWESEDSELYRGVMRARWYPFNMPGRWFCNMNVQVYWARFIPYLSYTYPWFMPCIQDTELTVPPNPSVLEDLLSVPFEGAF